MMLKDAYKTSKFYPVTNFALKQQQKPESHAVSSDKSSVTANLLLHSLSAVLLTDRGSIFSRATLTHHAKTSTIKLHIYSIQRIYKSLEDRMRVMHTD